MCKNDRSLSKVKANKILTVDLICEHMVVNRSADENIIFGDGKWPSEEHHINMLSMLSSWSLGKSFW